MLPIEYKFLAPTKKSFLTDYGLPMMPRLTPTPKSITLDATKALEFTLFDRSPRGSVTLAVNVYSG